MEGYSTTGKKDHVKEENAMSRKGRRARAGGKKANTSSCGRKVWGRKRREQHARQVGIHGRVDAYDEEKTKGGPTSV